LYPPFENSTTCVAIGIPAKSVKKMLAPVNEETLSSISTESIAASKLIGGITPTVKFIYSEKAAKFCEIFTLLLSYVVPVKNKVKISQNFVAFSEYMNFTYRKNNNLEKCPGMSLNGFQIR
jgi:hypothetical protein